ncbi:hypothetical protein [Streptomyces tailanensis]|uniref:hypothetical protein n=1 Tax=Streptomyces tailanensis TaxID=2569858 RepID=UPI00122EA380|nr:hypothetical protein [Streptomyces tailanensis]
MNQQGGTRVERSQGFIHTGPGNIYVNGGAHPQDSDKSAFRRVAEDQLRWLRRVLLDPSGMGKARAVLADTGTVVLDGPPGSGRTSAARVLLRECRRDSGVFHELLPGEEDELALHDPALVGTGDQLLLDLYTADDRQRSAARADVPALRKAVQVTPGGDETRHGLPRQTHRPAAPRRPRSPCSVLSPGPPARLEDGARPEGGA